MGWDMEEKFGPKKTRKCRNFSLSGQPIDGGCKRTRGACHFIHPNDPEWDDFGRRSRSRSPQSPTRRRRRTYKSRSRSPRRDRARTPPYPSPNPLSPTMPSGPPPLSAGSTSSFASIAPPLPTARPPKPTVDTSTDVTMTTPIATPVQTPSIPFQEFEDTQPSRSIPDAPEFAPYEPGEDDEQLSEQDREIWMSVWKRRIAAISEAVDLFRRHQDIQHQIADAEALKGVENVEFSGLGEGEDGDAAPEGLSYNDVKVKLEGKLQEASEQLKLQFERLALIQDQQDTDELPASLPPPPADEEDQEMGDGTALLSTGWPIPHAQLVNQLAAEEQYNQMAQFVDKLDKTAKKITRLMLAATMGRSDVAWKDPPEAPDVLRIEGMDDDPEEAESPVDDEGPSRKRQRISVDKYAVTLRKLKRAQDKQLADLGTEIGKMQDQMTELMNGFLQMEDTVTEGFESAVEAKIEEIKQWLTEMDEREDQVDWENEEVVLEGTEQPVAEVLDGEIEVQPEEGEVNENQEAAGGAAVRREEEEQEEGEAEDVEGPPEEGEHRDEAPPSPSEPPQVAERDVMMEASIAGPSTLPPSAQQGQPLPDDASQHADDQPPPEGNGEQPYDPAQQHPFSTLPTSLAQVRQRALEIGMLTQRSEADMASLTLYLEEHEAKLRTLEQGWDEEEERYRAELARSEENQRRLTALLDAQDEDQRQLSSLQNALRAQIAFAAAGPPPPPVPTPSSSQTTAAPPHLSLQTKSLLLNSLKDELVESFRALVPPTLDRWKQEVMSGWESESGRLYGTTYEKFQQSIKIMLSVEASLKDAASNTVNGVPSSGS